MRTRFQRGVAESLALHLFGRGSIPSCTAVIHGQEAKRLRQGNAVRAGLKELDLRRDLAEHRVQHQSTHGPVRNRPLGQHSRAAGQREPLNHTDELGFVHREDRAFIVGDADSRGAITLTGRFGLLGHGLSIATRSAPVKVTSVPADALRRSGILRNPATRVRAAADLY